MKTKFIIDLSEMINLETQMPAEGQECSVAIINKSGKLHEYHGSVEWDSDGEDWYKQDDEWVSGDRSAPVMSEFECLSIYWKPAPCSS